jgi:predicted flap endonuclease-1-like 5' DNA nuclease
VVSFAQIAAWTEADIVAIDAQLGTFAGRSTRDQWVAQAQFLAAGDVAGYEAKFGKL